MTDQQKDEALDCLGKIVEVEIDGPGQVFKYILIQVSVGSEKRDIVRGFKRCNYHDDIFEEFKATIKGRPLVKSKCLGGGRIDHKSDSILIYGYSQGYGRANHEISAKLVKVAFPNKDVQWNNDGY